MATRATVKIENFKICKMYKHWDGNPGAMLPWLEEFNKDFTEKRGGDISYKMAQLLRSSALLAEKFNLDNDPLLGYGIIGYSDNSGEQFEYTLKSDGTVTYKHNF